MRRLVFPIALLAVSCITEQSYVERIGNTWCRRQAECNRADFERRYSDHRDCVEDFTDGWGEVQDCAIDAGCEWQPEEARKCRAEMRALSCEDFGASEYDDECDEIYDCSQAQQVEVLACVLRN